MFELNKNMKINAAKIFAELIKTKYDEKTLRTSLRTMGDSTRYIYDTIDDINGIPVECYYMLINPIDEQVREDGCTIDRYITIIVPSDGKAILAEMTTTVKFISRNGVLDFDDDTFSTAREISIAEAVELWED